MFEMFNVPLIYLIVLMVISFTFGAVLERSLIVWREEYEKKKYQHINQQWQGTLNDLENDLKSSEEGHFSVVIPMSDTTLEQATKPLDSASFAVGTDAAYHGGFNTFQLDYDSKGKMIGMSAVPPVKRVFETFSDLWMELTPEQQSEALLGKRPADLPEDVSDEMLDRMRVIYKTVWDKDRFPRQKAADEDRFKDK